MQFGTHSPIRIARLSKYLHLLPLYFPDLNISQCRLWDKPEISDADETNFIFQSLPMESQNPLGTFCVINTKFLKRIWGISCVQADSYRLRGNFKNIRTSAASFRLSISVSHFHTQNKATNKKANRRPWTRDWHLHAVGKYWVGISTKNLLMVFLGDPARDNTSVIP